VGRNEEAVSKVETEDKSCYRHPTILIQIDWSVITSVPEEFGVGANLVFARCWEAESNKGEHKVRPYNAHNGAAVEIVARFWSQPDF